MLSVNFKSFDFVDDLFLLVSVLFDCLKLKFFVSNDDSVATGFDCNEPSDLSEESRLINFGFRRLEFP